MSVESANVYHFPMVSAPKTFLDVANRFEVLNPKKEDSILSLKNPMKMVARLIAAEITLQAFAKFAMYANLMGIVYHTGAQVASSLLGRNINAIAHGNLRDEQILALGINFIASFSIMIHAMSIFYTVSFIPEKAKQELEKLSEYAQAKYAEFSAKHQALINKFNAAVERLAQLSGLQSKTDEKVAQAPEMPEAIAPPLAPQVSVYPAAPGGPTNMPAPSAPPAEAGA